MCSGDFPEHKNAIQIHLEPQLDEILEFQKSLEALQLVQVPIGIAVLSLGSRPGPMGFP
jgi:hypothetical protein